MPCKAKDDDCLANAFELYLNCIASEQTCSVKKKKEHRAKENFIKFARKMIRKMVKRNLLESLPVIDKYVSHWDRVFSCLKKNYYYQSAIFTLKVK